MKRLKKHILPISLLSASAVLSIIHYGLFHNHHYVIQEHFLGELAFIPIEVLIVTLLIDKVIERREKHKLLQKIYILIGVFFDEIGSELLNKLAKGDKNLKELREEIDITVDWDKDTFAKKRKYLINRNCLIDERNIYPEDVAELLESRKQSLLRLLENPVLLEHDCFTELVRSIFHLEQEFVMRYYEEQLSDEYRIHLRYDLTKVYNGLLSEYLNYMEYLKNEYPGLYVFELKTNRLFGDKKKGEYKK